MHDCITWVQQAYIKASNVGGADGFGRRVAIHNDTIVVGSTGKDSAASTIDGDGTDNSVTNAGAAYVFVSAGTIWSQQAFLRPTSAAPGDTFARALALSGNRLLIGGPNDDSAATGVDGDAFNDDAFNAGGAYLYLRTGSSWAQHAYLKAINTNPSDLFGTAVGISGDLIVLGASAEDSGSTGVDGAQGGSGILNFGAVYQLRRRRLEQRGLRARRRYRQTGAHGHGLARGGQHQRRRPWQRRAERVYWSVHRPHDHGRHAESALRHAQRRASVAPRCGYRRPSSTPAHLIGVVLSNAIKGVTP